LRRGRAIAILEHDVALLLSLGNKKIKSLAELKKIAVLAENDNSIAFVRSFFDDRSDAATRIQPADAGATLDKLFSAFVMAHESAAEYINDDTKSFMDRYSDMLYLGAAALSVIGSIFAGALRQGHPDRTGTGQRARHSDPRHRPEDRARAFAGRA
jgi:hypothetical protein